MNISNDVIFYSQTELFGQNLYSITCPEDHSDLSKYLAPDPPDDYFPGELNDLKNNIRT